ncbi:MAG: class I SAM-dependent methyltransferase [Dehalococcoidia bacterium]|nr:class I SAM-dependent methyltransferase [Dehalococcoidia bacterium]MDH4300407.1 class I SAM-dependent methyltransferase [Dehalococcoidia bacterium]
MTTNRQVFDQIAESWYRVRHWPLLRDELDALAARWQSGNLLNVGCAHGPDFLPFAQTFELNGLDVSVAMLRQAMTYSAKFRFYVNLISGDALFLPFANNTFDWAISVATYHHIKGGQEREKAFEELRRVLKPKGEAFVTVWNRGQPRFWFRSKEQRVPWRLKERTVYRYYHLFSYRELRKALIRSGWAIVAMSPEKSYHFPIREFSHNICVLVKKC